jgi:hypothetical protein
MGTGGSLSFAVSLMLEDGVCLSCFMCVVLGLQFQLQLLLLTAKASQQKAAALLQALAALP